MVLMIVMVGAEMYFPGLERNVLSYSSFEGPSFHPDM